MEGVKESDSVTGMLNQLRKYKGIRSINPSSATMQGILRTFPRHTQRDPAVSRHIVHGGIEAERPALWIRISERIQNLGSVWMDRQKLPGKIFLLCEILAEKVTFFAS